MTTTKIPYLEELYFEDPANVPGRLASSGAVIHIDQINWTQFPHKLDVTVYVGHCNKKLWLHYVVGNDFVRAINHNDQEPVWQDSCVEFFIKQGGEYRNFEFNSLGVCLSAIGADRHSRKPLDKANLEQTLRWPSLKSESLPSEDHLSDWSLTIAIPLELIGLENENKFMANFYKCGDETKVPHYISWSPIKTSSPDFHRPEYFSRLELER